ncbi:MAG: monovalent cation/H(+) antiporter subunit G [Erysipelotrichaceae bacterium]|nr:monovalent cation/H(+) antiporter subunit G [Erysipelotrichaceae bacterium]
MMTLINVILGTLFLFGGLFVVVASVFGNYKFRYVLNRMHSSAMQDTLGLLFVLIGLIFYSGFTFVALKFLFVIVFFWISSPACSHLLVRMEVTTNEKIKDEVEVIIK